MHKNNFDFLRLLFSISVLVSHSYAISGTESEDFALSITNGQAIFSYFGLRGFFILSGFLIFQSLSRSTSILDYLQKRILRIYPGLIVMAIATCILCYFASNQTFSSYFGTWSVYKYFFRTLPLFMRNDGINGVFINNPYPITINGSLWTIPYEFLCYIILLSFYNIRKNIALIQKYFLLIIFLLYIINILIFTNKPRFYFFLSGEFLLNFLLYFAIGAYLATIKTFIEKYKYWILVFGVILLLISFHFYLFRYLEYFSISFIVISFGLMATKGINDLGNKIGDLSYGIYIYGFPVQQALVYFYRLDYEPLFLYSLTITCILAYFSWYFVEKPALKYKNINLLNQSKI